MDPDGMGSERSVPTAGEVSDDYFHIATVSTVFVFVLVLISLAASSLTVTVMGAAGIVLTTVFAALDISRLNEADIWDRNPALWVLGMLLLFIIFAPAYLILRRRATPKSSKKEGKVIVDGPSPSEDVSELQALDGVDVFVARKLRIAQVETFEELLDGDTEEIAARARLPVETVEDLQSLSGLLEVKGLGRKRAIELISAGIGSRGALAEAEPEEIETRTGIPGTLARGLPRAADVARD